MAELIPPRPPIEATDFDEPGPLIQTAQGGRVTIRATQQIGRSWTERFFLRIRDLPDRAFLALVRNHWARGTVFERKHPDYAAIKGAGGGTPQVDGASQVGAVLDVKNGPVSTTNWLRAGDVFAVAGLQQSFQVLADVTTDGTGLASLTISPPLFEGGSPADNALLTLAPALRVVLIAAPQYPNTGADDYGELALTYREAL